MIDDIAVIHALTINSITIRESIRNAIRESNLRGTVSVENGNGDGEEEEEKER